MLRLLLWRMVCWGRPWEGFVRWSLRWGRSLLPPQWSRAGRRRLTWLFGGEGSLGQVASVSPSLSLAPVTPVTPVMVGCGEGCMGQVDLAFPPMGTPIQVGSASGGREPEAGGLGSCLPGWGGAIRASCCAGGGLGQVALALPSSPAVRRTATPSPTALPSALAGGWEEGTGRRPPPSPIRPSPWTWTPRWGLGARSHLFR